MSTDTPVFSDNLRYCKNQGRFAMLRKFTAYTQSWSVLCLMLVSYSSLGTVVVAEEQEKKQSDDNAPKYQLNYQFKAGEFVHYQVSDTSSFTTQKDAVKETAKNQTTAWRQYRVVSVDESGEAVLELMIDRVQMQTQFDEHPPIVFDSADPKLQPERFRYILKTVGRPMSRIRVNQQGELLKVQTFFGKQPEQTDPNLSFLVVFPKEPIAINETWKQNLEVEVPVTKTLKEKVKLLRLYTLKSVENDQATIALTTILISKIRDPAIKVRLMQQTPTGTILFDMKRHLLISRKLNTDDQVIGAFGAGTLVKAMSIRSETLQPGKIAKSTTPEIR